VRNAPTQGRSRPATAMALAATFCLMAMPLAHADSEEFARLVAEKSPTLVTLKYNLKMRGGPFGGDQENEGETTGVMIDPRGLVLCSNTKLGGFASMFRTFGGFEMTVTPTDLKVLIGEDTEGIEARLMARDTELDLAWIEIKDPGDRRFAHLDLSQSTRAELGQRLYSVVQLGRYFDRANIVTEGRIGGRTTKPRELYVPASSFGDMGLPAFTSDGRLVGFHIMQAPDSEGGMGNMLSMLSDMQRGMILPAAEVLKATQRARETAPPAGVDAPTDDASPDDDDE
jgi:S1-C subfamily serine protease